MTNIPTDLLRTFVSVVDLRSFTRAAQAQGVTQPAVSAQIKRLQSMLGCELLDKSSPGVCLTPAGEIVMSQARRLLSINDQILNLAGPQGADHVLRIGMPRDAIRPELTQIFARFRARNPELRFMLKGEPYDVMIRGLRRGEFDLVFAMSIGGSNAEARKRWTEQMVWIKGPAFDFDPRRPVPLVAFSRDCGSHRLAVDALEKTGYSHELVFESPNVLAVNEAVIAGIGVMAGPRVRMPVRLNHWRDTPLPPLQDALCGIHVREGEDNEVLEQLADALAELYGPPSDQQLDGHLALAASSVAPSMMASGQSN